MTRPLFCILGDWRGSGGPLAKHKNSISDQRIADGRQAGRRLATVG